jgi:outer membrane protein assembly factor BamA
MIKKYIAFLLIIACCLGFLSAEEEKECKNRIIFSPLMFYTPETRLAFGGAGSYIFRLAGCKGSTRPSSVSPLVIYTLEKQFRALVKSELYFKNNNYRLESEIKFEKYPNKFFGIGSSTRESDKEIYTSKSINFQLSVLKKLVKGFHLGLGYHFMDWAIPVVEADGQLVSGTIAGSDRCTISGVSLILYRDTRDHLFSPMKGDLFKLDARFYPEFLGSTFAFTAFTIDLRKYFTLFSSHVFAVQSLVKIQTGTVPFLNLAQMGGEYTMRGYFQGRYRDKNLLVFQAEYRLQLVWRLGLVGFAGLGNVAERFNQLDLGRLKSSYGFGLRYLFSKTEKIQLRFDIGFAEGSTGFYASIYEAF